MQLTMHGRIWRKLTKTDSYAASYQSLGSPFVLPFWIGQWTLADILAVAHDGLGKDMWTVPFDKITEILRVSLAYWFDIEWHADDRVVQIYYVDEVFYLGSIGLTKVSILLFYLRIFPAQNFRRGVYITLALCITYLVAFIPAFIFQCLPVHISWERWDGQHHGKCEVNLNAAGWASTAFNILLDLIVICLPLRELSRLKMGRRKKAGIMIMFLGGGL